MSSDRTAIAVLLGALLLAQAGIGPSGSTEIKYVTLPVVVAVESATTGGPPQPHTPLPLSSISVGVDVATAVRDATEEATIATRVVQLNMPSPAHARYLLDAANAIVALHQAGVRVQDLGEFAARLTAARQSLIESVESCEHWLLVAQAVAPGAERYDVPDRFLVNDELPTRLFTAEDSAIISAASDFLGQRA